MTTIYESHAIEANNGRPEKESMLAAAQQSSEDCIRERPLTSAAIAVGAGAALGLLASVLLSSGEKRRRQGLMAQISQQVSDRLGQYVPDSVYRNR